MNGLKRSRFSTNRVNQSVYMKVQRAGVRKGRGRGRDRFCKPSKMTAAQAKENENVLFIFHRNTVAFNTCSRF